MNNLFINLLYNNIKLIYFNLFYTFILVNKMAKIYLENLIKF